MDLTEKILAWAKSGSAPLQALYGFGSTFSHQSNPESDIDLAALFSQPVSNIERWKFQEALASRLGRNVDLVDLSKASLVMKHQVVGSGTRLFCSDENACNLFETYILSAYCRFQEERKPILAEVFHEGSVYGR